MKTFKSFLDEKGRCWPGYKPVPGKDAYSLGSCKKEDYVTSENMDHGKDNQAVEELKSALLSRKKEIQLVKNNPDKVYSIINMLMTTIAKSHGISGQKMHDMWVDCYKEIPDTWIMNETSILKDNLREDLRKWFKQKWVRMDTKGNIKGDCARDPGEGKPKCLPQAKAQSLGKEGRASAAQRKRREDPNPDRQGKPINVRTESAAAAIAAATAIAKKKSGNYDSKGFRKTPYKNPDSPLIKSNAERKKEQE